LKRGPIEEKTVKFTVKMFRHKQIENLVATFKTRLEIAEVKSKFNFRELHVKVKSK
jgi:hypothetical protein